MAKKTLGHLLLDRGLIDERQLNAALQEEKRWDNLARACRELQLVDEDDLVQAVSDFYKLPKVDLAVTRISPEAVRILDRAWCEEHECLAFEYQPQGKFLHVAMTNPTDATIFDKIRVATKCNVRPFVAGQNAIRNALDQTYRRRADSIEMQFALSDEDLEGLGEGEGKGEAAKGGAARGAGAPLTAEVRGELDDLRDRLDVMTDALERTERLLGFVVEQLSAKGVLPRPPKELMGAAADDDEAQFDLDALMGEPVAAESEPQPQPQPQPKLQPEPEPEPRAEAEAEADDRSAQAPPSGRGRPAPAGGPGAAPGEDGRGAAPQPAAEAGAGGSAGAGDPAATGGSPHPRGGRWLRGLHRGPAAAGAPDPVQAQVWRTPGGGQRRAPRDRRDPHRRPDG